MRSLFRDRSRLRIPALLGGVVLLLASGVGTAGLDVCLYHGSHQHGAEHAAGENQHHGHGHTGDHPHGHDRAHHGPDHEPNHGPDHEHSHDHPMGGEDCDFRILCVGAAGIAPLSPQLIEVGDVVATAPRFEPQVDEVELLHPTLIPHFLPFPNAPPAHC